MALSEIQIKNAKAAERPYKLADGEGLFLLVKENGSKLWRLKYRYRGKEKLLSFGAYPDVGIAAARELKTLARAALAEGSFFDQHVVEDDDLGYFALDEGDYNALPAHLARRVVHTVKGAMLDEY